MEAAATYPMILKKYIKADVTMNDVMHFIIRRRIYPLTWRCGLNELKIDSDAERAKDNMKIDLFAERAKKGN